MKISSAFPSNYLKAADLDGRSVTVTIAKVIMEQVNRGGDPQPVIYFDGHTKGMVLNKTNAKKITEVYGDDTDNWVKGRIILFEAMVEFQGDTVAALRVRNVPTRDDRYPNQALPKEPDRPQPQVTHPIHASPGSLQQPSNRPAEVSINDSTSTGPVTAQSSPGSQASSLIVEAEAMTRLGIDAFRTWRDGLGEEEFQQIHTHMGRLIEMANHPENFPRLSERTRKTLKKSAMSE